MAAAAGLLALTFAVTAGLALTFDSPFMDNTPGLRAFLQTNTRATTVVASRPGPGS